MHPGKILSIAFILVQASTAQGADVHKNESTGRASGEISKPLVVCTPKAETQDNKQYASVPIVLQTSDGADKEHVIPDAQYELEGATGGELTVQQEGKPRRPGRVLFRFSFRKKKGALDRPLNGGRERSVLTRVYRDIEVSTEADSTYTISDLGQVKNLTIKCQPVANSESLVDTLFKHEEELRAQAKSDSPPTDLDGQYSELFKSIDSAIREMDDPAKKKEAREKFKKVATDSYWQIKKAGKAQLDPLRVPSYFEAEQHPKVLQLYQRLEAIDKKVAAAKQNKTSWGDRKALLNELRKIKTEMRSAGIPAGSREGFNVTVLSLESLLMATNK